MCRIAISIVLSACAASAIAQDAGRYDGYKVVRVDVRTARDLATTLALTDDVWSHRVGIGGPVDINVSPAQLAVLAGTGMNFTVLIDNLQALIDAERNRVAQNQWAGDGPTFFNDFRTYDQHRQFLQDLVTAYPNLAQMVVVGQSLEGRDIFGIKITGPGSTASRPAAFYNAAQHAREWATPPVIAYIAQQLLENYSTDCHIKHLVDNVEWYLVPFANPDGYVYTWTPNNRLWRKNRQPPPTGSTCFGVDTNRNWGYQWGGQGAATDPCDETYRGVAGFSEIETQVIRDYVAANPRFVASMDFHSYSQLVMSPWAYTNALPPDHPTFTQLNNAMAQAILNTHGKVYDAGPIYTTIYPASGGAVDWFYGSEGIWAFTIEVRPTGNPGFLLPAAEIIPNAEENYNAILALTDFIASPLTISPGASPSFVAPNQTANVTVTIANASGQYQSGSGKIYTRIGTSGSFSASPLTLVAGNTYQGTLPAAPCGQTIQYYFEAQATGGAVVLSPTCAPNQVYSTTASTLSVVLEDTFEVAGAWTVSNDPSLTSGGFVRADPVGTTNAGQQAQPENDATPDPGVNCYVTQNGTPGGAAGSADVDGGPTRLTSPLLNLSSAPTASVSYSYWHYSVNGSPDLMRVEVSNNDGQTWTLAATHTGASGWRTNSFRVQQFVPPTAPVRVRFVSTDKPHDSLTETAVDDFRVSTLGCGNPCYADCNADGSLTVADFGCFQTKFVAADPYADCNADGSLTVADFGCFQTKFVAGCP